MKLWNKFLSKICAALVAVILVSPCNALADNLPQIGGDIGDAGTWATDYNIGQITDLMNTDLGNISDSFTRHQMADNYVPAEAKVGIIFMNAMSWLGKILDKTLIPFITIFILIAYAFWVMLEAYNMMKKGSGARKFCEDIAKKGAIIAVWLIIINMDPAKMFVYVMGPVLTIGTAFADLILNAVSAAIDGLALPDTCSAIRAYTTSHTNTDMLLDANMAANIMCLPTRMSGLFYTAINVGFKWMWQGISSSALTFVVGAVFVGVFVVNIWKFALVALGVIADLFLAVLMLPFTAVSETVSKTSYDGIAGNIYNGFIGLLKVDSLSAQIQRYIGAAVYFVVLSIIIALCSALLAPTINTITGTGIPNADNTGFIVPLMMGCLVLHLANKADSYAKQWGGEINDSLGQQIGKDAIGLVKDVWKTGRGWDKAMRGR